MDIDYAPLKQVGLSKLAIACYGVLASSSGMRSLSQVQKALSSDRKSAYRVLKQLQNKGFAYSYDWLPGIARYGVNPLGQALANLHAMQRQELNDMIRRQEATYLSRSQMKTPKVR